MMDVLRSHSAASGADVPGEREGGRIGQVPRAALRRSPGPVFWGLFVVLLLFDQASKWWILAHAADLPVSLIPGLLNLVSVRNTGIVFGLFSGYNWLWIVVGAAFLFAGLLVGRRLDWGRPEIGSIAALLAAGAAGNIGDRVFHGFVVDFIDVHIGSWHWPSFNVADSCLCLASLWMILRIGANSEGRA